MVDIFIYKPWLKPNENVVPDLCYTLKGQNFRDWQVDQTTVRDYKIEQIKKKLSTKKNPHYVEDYWR
jgi:hypothetical protein